MSTLPNYGPAVEQVGKWIAEACKLEVGKTAFLEPTLPDAPDRVASVFEIGGTWNRERGWIDLNLLLVTRAATLLECRALAINSINGALDKFAASAKPRPHNIAELQLPDNGFPTMQPRDERKRVIIESRLLLRIRALSEEGVPQ